jgi:hypothetical protein
MNFPAGQFSVWDWHGMDPPCENFPDGQFSQIGFEERSWPGGQVGSSIQKQVASKSLLAYFPFGHVLQRLFVVLFPRYV